MADLASSALYLRVVLTLVGVIAVLGLGAFVLRRYGLATRLGAGGKRRLGLVEIAAIDAKHRLVLIRRDATEHLLLIGPAGATLVERGITTPTVFALDRTS